jgi:hypothetical protein
MRMFFGLNGQGGGCDPADVHGFSAIRDRGYKQFGFSCL